MSQSSQITVTSPLLPDLEEFNALLRDIWQRKWITNNGYYHELLEHALADYLGVEYLSLFTNGTLPLVTALQALKLKHGEVITTPYSFVATSHAIWWNGLKPVFVDIDAKTGNIDPQKIERAITADTIAIMPVHVYGTPCDVEVIQRIADKYHLKVIYDAAHAFGVRTERNIFDLGDVSTLSFHATKVFNTIEGGALICHSREMKEKIDHLKNFGFEDEVTVVAPGINAKMDEIRAAYGLLNLRQVDDAIVRRRNVAEQYVKALQSVKGIQLYRPIVESLADKSVRCNYSYFPVFIDASEYGISRDDLYEKMRSQNILSRRYFYPLITDFEPYCHYPSAAVDNLPIANKFASEVICLPMHHALESADIELVLSVILK